MKKIIYSLVVVIVLIICIIIYRVDYMHTTKITSNSTTKTATITPTIKITIIPTITAPATITPSITFPTKPPIITDLLSNKLSGWGFVSKKGGQPNLTSGQINTMKKYGCIYMGTDTDKVLYLTFDEGYENGYTAQILDVLKNNNIKASFFITSGYFNHSKSLVDRMVNEGHIVGNHTVSHKSLPALSDNDVKEEILGLERKYDAAYGQQMKYFRPPMGEYSDRTLAITQNLGYTSVFWSLAYVDWETDNQLGTDNAYNHVMNYIQNGCVVLLHAVSKDNANALDSIIKDAQAQGYVFKSLDEYKY